MKTYSIENVILSFTEEEVEELLCALDFTMCKTNEFNLSQSYSKFEDALRKSQKKWYETIQEEN